MDNKDEPRKPITFRKQSERIIRINSTSKVIMYLIPTPKVLIDGEPIKDITHDLAILIEKTIKSQIANAPQDYQNYNIEWGEDSDHHPAVQIQKSADQ
ncbi:hypothetical protein [Acidithiobacillus sp.]|uniref:hypothetical protein n=1 Tax=Acidithiobacillus sp. TaxID=1872118 RepID=UPI0025B92A36|nr:hypothetical protein [Acidithiobacillus sp.]